MYLFYYLRIFKKFVIEPTLYIELNSNIRRSIVEIVSDYKNVVRHTITFIRCRLSRACHSRLSFSLFFALIRAVAIAPPAVTIAPVIPIATVAGPAAIAPTAVPSPVTKGTMQRHVFFSMLKSN